MTTRSLGPIVLQLLLLVQLLSVLSANTRTTFAAAQSSPLPALDPDCIRFVEPSAAANGDIAFVGFTSHVDAMHHAVAVWSPEQGFGIPFRELASDDDAIPPGATLIYRDAAIPGSTFKGVTVTWSKAPSTITLNLATMPPAGSTDAHDQQVILSVMAHETGHALGLGDVPAPGVTIRECANMLMKRSVDKGGGAFIAPQVGDIALYCQRWGGPICGQDATTSTPAAAENAGSALPPLDLSESGANGAVPYRFFVVTCGSLPPNAVTPAHVASDTMMAGCGRAPAGVLFEVQRDDGASFAMLTNGQGEFEIRLPDGVMADVAMDRGGEGRFPSLVGFQPVADGFRITGNDPGCATNNARRCEVVYLLVP